MATTDKTPIARSEQYQRSLDRLTAMLEADRWQDDEQRAETLAQMRQQLERRDREHMINQLENN